MSREPGVWERVYRAGDQILAACVAAGGVLSGEHGIGLEKSAFMPWIYGPDDLDAMQRVKAALDPRGLLNPGKIFPDPERPRAHLGGRTGFASEARWW